MKNLIVILSLVSVGFMTLSLTENNPTEKTVDSPPVVELTWYTHMNEAHAASNATGKPIFAFFTGSDWCGWCHKLQREVFAKEAFVKWADANVILLELDFPRRTKLEPELAQQNQNLQKVFNVRGYPTVWIFNTTFTDSTNNMNIAALGSLGYPSGAVKGQEEVLFIKNADKILANKPK